jgi:hypothetical protein
MSNQLRNDGCIAARQIVFRRQLLALRVEHGEEIGPTAIIPPIRAG